MGDQNPYHWPFMGREIGKWAVLSAKSTSTLNFKCPLAWVVSQRCVLSGVSKFNIPRSNQYTFEVQATGYSLIHSHFIRTNISSEKMNSIYLRNVCSNEIALYVLSANAPTHVSSHDELSDKLVEGSPYGLVLHWRILCNTGRQHPPANHMCIRLLSQIDPDRIRGESPYAISQMPDVLICASPVER